MVVVAVMGEAAKGSLVPTGADPTEIREKDIRRLAAEFRQRLPLSLLTGEVPQYVASAIVEILESGTDLARVTLLKELLRHFPPPEPQATGKGSQAPVVAIQVNGNLQRGKA